jgi:hypothetical protein
MRLAAKLCGEDNLRRAVVKFLGLAKMIAGKPARFLSVTEK